MSWELLLLLLPLAGVAGQAPRYQVSQPESVSAPAGGCVLLPCNFSYPDELEPVRDLWVYWRRGGFFGDSIYNHTKKFTHRDYRGRVALARDPPGNRTASIRIDPVRASDANVYVCQVGVLTRTGAWETWRHINGTRLTVPDPAPRGSAPLGLLGLLGLGSAAAKAGVCLAVFALGRRLGLGRGPGDAL